MAVNQPLRLDNAFFWGLLVFLSGHPHIRLWIGELFSSLSFVLVTCIEWMFFVRLRKEGFLYV